MLALYRKYRPQRFADIVGQEHVVGVLQRALSEHRVSHAYLFSGPRGTGKTTIARLLARAANCANIVNRSEETADVKLRIRSAASLPCNACDSCKELQSGMTLDLMEIDAASSRGIDEMRALREGVQIMPLRAAYRTYVIDEVHMLTKEAFNALLKTLEEPPGHVMFILATTELEKVPDTIISRCQHFRFLPLSETQIRGALKDVLAKEQRKADNEALGLLAFFAAGSLRDGYVLLEQTLYAGSGTMTGADVRRLFGAPPAFRAQEALKGLVKGESESALSAIHTAGEEGTDPRLFLNILLRDSRTLLRAKLAPSIKEKLYAEHSESERAFLEALGADSAPERIQTVLVTLLDAYDAQQALHHPALALELAASLLRIPKSEKTA